jgi:hypothetical protein
MPQTALPNLGLDYEWDLGNDAWKTGMDDNLALLDNLVMPNINFALKSVSAEPGAPTNGDAYIIGASPTGIDWGVGSPDREDWFAVWYTGTGWHFAEPREGWKIYDRTSNTWYQYNGTAWVTAEVLEYIFACSDLTTEIVAGTNVAYFHATRDMTIVEVKVSLLTAQQGSPAVDFTVDVNNEQKSPRSIFTTLPTIDNGEDSTETAATPAVIADGSVTEDDRITIDIDVAGLGAAGCLVYILAVVS